MSTSPLNASVEQLVVAVQLMASDVKASAGLTKIYGDTPFARRTYVRAVFAMIEGNINLMANVILSAASRDEIQLSTKELEILRQERTTRSEGGVETAQVKFVPTRDRLAPVLAIFPRLYGESFQLDKGTAGWVSFVSAIDVRNRITHPKNVTSFEVTDHELDTIEVARNWFADNVEAMLTNCVAEDGDS